MCVVAYLHVGCAYITPPESARRRRGPRDKYIYICIVCINIEGKNHKRRGKSRMYKHRGEMYKHRGNNDCMYKHRGERVVCMNTEGK